MGSQHNHRLPPGPGLSILNPVGAQVPLRFWDDQCVAYDPRSGDTHLLGTLAGRIVLCASGGTTEFCALVEQTAHALGIEPDDEFVARVASIVTELQTKGLLSH